VPFVDEKIVEGLPMQFSQMSETYAVEDGLTYRPRLRSPGHLCLQFHTSLVRPENKIESRHGLEALGQFQTGPPFAQVAGPAHAGSPGRWIQALVENRKPDRVAGVPPF
jgi:hypothetical protein